MFGLEAVADAFDRYHKQWDTAVEGWLDRSVTDVGMQLGPDAGATTGVAVAAGVVWAASTFIGGVLGGFADVARLGDGVAKGTWSGVGQDGLRVLAFAGPMLRQLRFISGYAVAGTEISNSCTMTAQTMAMRLTGTRLWLTLDELARAARVPSPVRTPGYAGVDLAPLLGALKRMGAVITHHGEGTVETVRKLILQRRGVVTFAFNYYEAEEIVAKGAHYVAGFVDQLGRVMVADQHGIRLLEELTMTESGLYPVKDIFIREINVIAHSKAFETQVAMITGANALFPGVSFAVEFWRLEDQTVQRVDEALRRLAGRPPRLPSPGTMVAKPHPPAGAGRPRPAALSPQATRLLARVPAAGEGIAAVLKVQANLSEPEWYSAVAELEAAKLVRARRVTEDASTILGLSRR
jgi:hypothetical protein